LQVVTGVSQEKKSPFFDPSIVAYRISFAANAPDENIVRKKKRTRKADTLCENVNRDDVLFEGSRVEGISKRMREF
jgi:hypothetical protein